MKKLLPILILFAICHLPFAISPAYAQKTDPYGRMEVEVSATIGEYYLSVSGFISPFASIVLTALDGTFIRATVADSGGNFSISQVLISEGFSGFCLVAVDFKRLGESTTCITFPPATGSIERHNLFLPPTLALSRSEIAAGSSVLAFGYTMPGAVVTLKLSNGQTLTTTADSTGYYEFTISGLAAGEYKLFATAHYYQGQESLSPTKQLGLRALSVWDQFLKLLRDLLNKLLELLTSIITNPLWLILPIIILIFILLTKLWPEKFTFIHEYRMRLFDRFHQRPLHHWWWVGY